MECHATSGAENVFTLNDKSVILRFGDFFESLPAYQEQIRLLNGSDSGPFVERETLPDLSLKEDGGDERNVADDEKDELPKRKPLKRKAKQDIVEVEDSETEEESEEPSVTATERAVSTATESAILDGANQAQDQDLQDSQSVNSPPTVTRIILKESECKNFLKTHVAPSDRKEEVLRWFRDHWEGRKSFLALVKDLRSFWGQKDNSWEQFTVMFEQELRVAKATGGSFVDSKENLEEDEEPEADVYEHPRKQERDRKRAALQKLKKRKSTGRSIFDEDSDS
ncbi:MAG: hypothetical protein SGILL_004966 [Bacillariaceae sp.]